jgi:integrase
VRHCGVPPLLLKAPKKETVEGAASHVDAKAVPYLCHQFLCSQKIGAYSFPRQKSLHSLRHSTGTTLYAASKDLVAVSSWLGQRSVESARRYTNISQTALNALAASAL